MIDIVELIKAVLVMTNFSFLIPDLISNEKSSAIKNTVIMAD